MKHNNHNQSSRRKFIQQSGGLIGGLFFTQSFLGKAFAESIKTKKIKVFAHLWVYASKYPPNWDSTPNLETVFSDLSYAGIEGVELMEINLRHNDAVKNLKNLIQKYNLPVSGTSYSSKINMWDESKQKEILDDVNLIVSRLKEVNGKTFGISVGDAKRPKTEKELDAQAEVLKKILVICSDNGVEPNLHNHTYEIINGMHDLKGTISRIPEIKLGPDLNWLIRAGVKPEEFINTYGDKISYLHIRDQYADGTWTEYLGQGVTNFKSIAKALKAQKFEGNVAIELAFPSGFKPVNTLKQDWKLSRQFVKKQFGW